jgi:hypothetical protein
MAKRRKKIKLSKLEQNERELNRWLAKRDEAIATLVKAATRLAQLGRAQARLQRREEKTPRKPKPDNAVLESNQHPQPAEGDAAPASRPARRVRKPHKGPGDSVSEQAERERRLGLQETVMEGLGFRRYKRR